MRRSRWQRLIHFAAGHKLSGAWVLALGLFMVSLDTCSETTGRWLTFEPEPPMVSLVLVVPPTQSAVQATGHEPLPGLWEMDTTRAYLQQFEKPGGAQWLPHSF